MVKNYDELIKKMKMRTNPDGIEETKLFDDSIRNELQKAYGSKVAEYVKRAMNGVDALYTQRTFEAGNKVMAHLKEGREYLDFMFQGSVPANTHIKGHSDIDLVQITNTFFWHDERKDFADAYSLAYVPETRNRLASIVNGISYPDWLENLKRVRLDAENILLNTYKNVNVGKGKSIEVEPTEPKRVVDVVTAAWHKTVNSVISNIKEEQGIKVYNKKTSEVLSVDYPFMKIKLLNEKDSSVNGRLKRMIRFLKVIKADTETETKKIALSSFDISSICYDIETFKYSDKSYLELVPVVFTKLNQLNNNEQLRNSIKSIDGTEFIFKNKPEKIEALKTLLLEVDSIIDELDKSLIMKIYG